MRVPSTKPQLQPQVMKGRASVTSLSSPAAQLVCSPPWLPPSTIRSLPFYSPRVFMNSSARRTRSAIPWKYAVSGSAFSSFENAYCCPFGEIFEKKSL